MKSAYIVSAIRTPGGKAPGGTLATMRPDDLAAHVIAQLLQKTGIDPMKVDDVILGCAFPEGEQGMNVARMAALQAGLPVAVPGMTINRLCSSGLQSIALAADRIMLGHADVIIAGGTESMSMVPMGGNKYSASPNLMGARPEAYASMGITAELVAEQYQVSRQDQDDFAVVSHQKAAKAQAEGKFADEIVTVDVPQVGLSHEGLQRRMVKFGQDEGVRANTSMEALARLNPVFKAGGSVTAGNASQMTDGAAATLVVSEEGLKELGLTPMARFAGFAVRGVPPEHMGIGPVVAIPRALRQAGIKQSDVDLIELNEAFAAQALAVMRQLELDPEKVNVNGGAIALGHPLGCTGAKLTATLLHEMKRRQSRYGLVSMCVGGGMGAAGIFERV